MKIIKLLILCIIHTNIISQDIAYLFVHGLGGDKDSKTAYQDHAIIPKDKTCFAFNGPEIVHTSYFQAKAVLGQEADIDCVVNGLKNDNKSNKPVIGIGVSKGAATLINGAGSDKIKNIKALVLDSCFSDANQIAFKHRLSTFFRYIPKGKNVTLSIMRYFFPSYNANGIQPIQTISKISRNIPIILLHSKEDDLVSIDHSRRLYRELIKQNRKNVYLVETNLGYHANIFWTEHGAKFYPNKLLINVVNEFYKKYKLPYNKRYIRNINLSQFQPDLNEINRRISDYKSSLSSLS